VDGVVVMVVGGCGQPDRSRSKRQATASRPPIRSKVRSITGYRITYVRNLKKPLKSKKERHFVGLFLAN
jgi:hypothetical protein